MVHGGSGKDSSDRHRLLHRREKISNRSATEEITLHGWAHGGEAVGRLADGRAVFVGYAIPGETVRVAVTESRKSWARARLVEVVEASPDRVEPPCPYFGPDRCGGCRLQHIAQPRQSELVRRVLVEQLERIGRIPDPPVEPTVEAGAYGYRTRARFAVDDRGHLGFRRAGSHEIVPIDRCLLLDAETQAARDEAGEAAPGVAEVEVRGTDVERVGGFSFRVSPGSFFQTNRQGAEILLRLVREAAAVEVGDEALDLYAGVGLFARGLAADGASVVAVESAPAAVADARVNLDGVAEVVQAPADQAAAALARAGRQVAVTVLDPPRAGAGAEVVTTLAGITTRVIVYVACDPAALARDAKALIGAGWSLARVTPVDQFAQTAAVEAVAVFTPPGRTAGT